MRNEGTFQQIKLRSMAAVDAWLFKTSQASWTKWTLSNAVKEGYEKSGWVYRAVSLIAKNGASVPWGIYNIETGELEPNHPLATVLAYPNPHFSRQDLFELIISWYQLTGVAYIKRAFNSNRTIELWPISPDRIAPVGSNEPGEIIKGYSVVNERGAQVQLSLDYTIENIIQFKIMDPANPLIGIGPLQAAARAVDTDNEQQEWNKSAMENRGVFDGVFTFKKDLTGPQHNTILEKIKERFSGSANARTPAVIGSDATYTRMSVTPAEMDFINSRKFNREEIFIIFGVPSQLAGSTEASTYNNYNVSLRIFWENTIIPLLDDLADTFNNIMRDELESGKYRIGYDTSNVRALRESEDEKAKTAKAYWEMGIPIATINEKMELGIPEFPNWELSWTGGKAPKEETNKKDIEEKSMKPIRHWSLIPIEQRSVEDEQKERDKLAETTVKNMFNLLLNEQKEAIFESLENKGDSPEEIIKASREKWNTSMWEAYFQIAMQFAGMVVINKRGQKPGLEFRAEYDSEIESAIEEYLDTERVILRDLSHIEESTINAIREQIIDAVDTGASVQVTTQAINDLGIFSEQRALMLARTLSGTAASIGQFTSANIAGADKKIWMNSGFEVRDIHIARNNEKRDMDDTFSDQGYGAPRYPLDINLGPADRVNCRCSMTFE